MTHKSNIKQLQRVYEKETSQLGILKERLQKISQSNASAVDNLEDLKAQASNSKKEKNNAIAAFAVGNVTQSEVDVAREAYRKYKQTLDDAIETLQAYENAIEQANEDLFKQTRLADMAKRNLLSGISKHHAELAKKEAMNHILNSFTAEHNVFGDLRQDFFRFIRNMLDDVSLDIEDLRARRAIINRDHNLT